MSNAPGAPADARRARSANFGLRCFHKGKRRTHAAVRRCQNAINSDSALFLNQSHQAFIEDSRIAVGSSPAGSPKPYYIMATRAASSSENRLGALVAILAW